MKSTDRPYRQLTPAQLDEIIAAKKAEQQSASTKAVENRLRRAARRQGLRLQKSRARDPYDYLYGTYMLTDADTNAVVHALWDTQQGFGLDLEDVAEYLFNRDTDLLMKRSILGTLADLSQCVPEAQAVGA